MKRPRPARRLAELFGTALLAALLVALNGCASTDYRAAVQPAGQAPDASLRGLSAVSDTVAWASGDNGTIARTVDGGQTWQTIAPPAEATERDLRDIEALSRDEALVMAVGAPARIWRTDDGGYAWRLVLDDPREACFLDAFDINDSGFGIAWGDPVDGAFLCYRTEDGGRTWTPLTTLPQPAPGEAGFAASGSCVLCDDDRVWIATGGGAVARVFRSPDRGERWLITDTPLPAGRSSAGVFSIASLHEKGQLVIVGGDHEEPAEEQDVAAWTANSGIVWLSAIRPPAGFRSCVAVGRGDLLICCGPTGVDESHDGGQTWLPVGRVGYHAVDVAPGGRSGYLVGPGGRTARLQVRALR